MKYEVRIEKRALKKLNKMDGYTKALLMSWIKKNLSDTDNPRQNGKALKGELSGLWRYRVGDYRVVAEIQDEEVLILIVDVGHRKYIYRK